MLVAVGFISPVDAFTLAYRPDDVRRRLGESPQRAASQAKPAGNENYNSGVSGGAAPSRPSVVGAPAVAPVSRPTGSLFGRR